jgi:hypothetical protein
MPIHGCNRKENACSPGPEAAASIQTEGQPEIEIWRSLQQATTLTLDSANEPQRNLI